MTWFQTDEEQLAAHLARERHFREPPVLLEIAPGAHDEPLQSQAESDTF